MFLQTILVICLASLRILDAANPKIGEQLQISLESKQTANIFIKFHNDGDHITDSIHGLSFMSRAHRIEYLILQLRISSKESQKGALEILRKHSKNSPNRELAHTELWITNELFIKNADISLVNQVADLSEVAEIREEAILPAIEADENSSKLYKINTCDTNKNDNDNDRHESVEWNIEKIEADKAWEIPGGNNGFGVVVASIDTGVRGSHEALRNNHRKEFGWFDPYYGSEVPTDMSQGTLTMGLLVGNGGIGVAPGAQWISCKGCDIVACGESQIKACAQWMVCPTDPKGENMDCSKAPRVLINGYGGGQGNTDMDDVFKVWKAAEIIPIFPVGKNVGQTCGSVASYGDSELVIGVGATNMMDYLADSRFGPNVRGALKPDITAPGENVRTADPNSDTGYRYISGTTMAASHVGGVAALLLSKNPKLNYDQIKSFMENFADKSLPDTGIICDGVPSTEFPNHQYGHGRLNALKALEAVIKGKEN